MMLVVRVSEEEGEVLQRRRRGTQSACWGAGMHGRVGAEEVGRLQAAMVGIEELQVEQEM